MLAATATLLIDDANVRVTRFDFLPDAQTGWHTHGMDYVIAAVTDCTMRLQEPDGASRDVTVAAGEAYSRSKGVSHNVINVGAAAMAFVEIELKASR